MTHSSDTPIRSLDPAQVDELCGAESMPFSQLSDRPTGLEGPFLSCFTWGPVWTIHGP
jgi:hypothetical protein